MHTCPEGLQVFPSGAKPDVKDIGPYLSARVRPKGDGGGFSVYKDPLGNFVFKSDGVDETGLYGRIPSQLVLSPEGKSLVKQNPGMLSKLARGESLLSPLGEGAEGHTHLFRSNGGTYVVKYTFPVEHGKTEDGRPAYFFTSQVDQMRVLQQFALDKPVDGVHAIKPVIATNNILVSEFEPDTLSYYELQSLLSQDGMMLLGDMYKTHRHRFADGTIEQVAKLFDWGVTTKSFEWMFRSKFADFLQSIQVGTWQWLNGIITYSTIPFINRVMSKSEPELPHNLIISIPQMFALRERVRKQPTLLENISEFRREVASCCHIVELVAACYALKQPSI